MDDARDVAAVLGAHHQHVAPIALGDHLLLQVLGGVAAAHELLEGGAQALPFLAEPLADAAQLRAGLVDHVASRIDGPADRGDFAGEVRGTRHRAQEDRERAGRLAHRRGRVADRVEQVGDAAQGERVEHLAVDAQAGQRLSNPGARPQREQRIALQERGRLAGGAQRLGHRGGVGQRLERRQRRLAHGRQRQAGDDLHDAIEFQRTKCEGHVRWTRAGGRRPRSYR